MIAKCSLVRVFLKAVPGSVQHNTAVNSVSKVPMISGKELKSMENDLQFSRSRTPRHREPFRICVRKVIQSIDIKSEECAQEISSCFICVTQHRL